MDLLNIVALKMHNAGIEQFELSAKDRFRLKIEVGINLFIFILLLLAYLNFEFFSW